MRGEYAPYIYIRKNKIFLRFCAGGMRRDVGDQNSIKLWLPAWFITPSGGMCQKVCAGYKRPMAGQTMSPAISGYARGMRRVQKIQLATLVDSGARPEITPGEPLQRTKRMRWTVCARGYALAERSRQRVQASLQKVRIINFWVHAPGVCAVIRENKFLF